jgi:hypothetical protein
MLIPTDDGLESLERPTAVVGGMLSGKYKFKSMSAACVAHEKGMVE